ncbi:MAG: hypothetical protein JSW54_12715 [Fidelibacterota bacterium]|nr:MAG: hypothetical protein JSW54_12715 [Candidatus Neomarinimicrobiota bacterium]
MQHEHRRLLLWLSLFSLAFGYIEAAVVVYLREPYYPGGFHFPLVAIPVRLVWTEVIREATTLLLLFSATMLIARSNLRRFAVFAFCFGTWDLVYYLSLKLLLDWPVSILDWDVLFLIPLPWTAPILAPVLVSLALIVAAVILIRLPEDQPPPFRPTDWLIEILAGVVIIASFLWNVPTLSAQEVPRYYPWWLFTIGFLIGVGWFALRLIHHRKETAAASR